MGACGTKGKQGEKEKKPGSTTPLSNRSGRRESQDSGRAQQQQQQQQQHHHHHSHHGQRAAPPPQAVDQNALPKLPSRRDDFECIGVEQLVGKQKDQADQLMNSIAVQQCLEVTIRLLRDGAPVNIMDSDGDTPLCHAIVGPAFQTPRGFAVLEYLATPQVLITSPQCLTLCGLLGRVKAMRRLIALGARPTGGELCACVANRDEDEEVETFESVEGQKALEELMQVLSVDEVDEEGFTPLLLACKNAKHRSALFFIARGADVTRRDASKCLPLHHAVSMDETKEAVWVPFFPLSGGFFLPLFFVSLGVSLL